MLFYDGGACRAAAGELRRPLARDADLAELVRYATLAASGHNAQPWRFRAEVGRMAILPDFARRTPVVDPDDHHLFASLGCAAENLALAARARGMAGEVTFDRSGEGGAAVDLAPGPARECELFRAIPVRQCSRASYDGRPVGSGVTARLVAAAEAVGAEAVVLAGRREIEDVLALILEGNRRQVADPDFVAELESWIRFNPDAALEARDGLYGAAAGHPAVPEWLGRILLRLTFREGSENARCAEQVRSSAGLVVLVAPEDAPAGWFAAGRAYQRLALRATADGLRHAFVNQAVEVAEVRRELAALLGLGERRPSLVLRVGHGPEMPFSLRRRVEDVLD